MTYIVKLSIPGALLAAILLVLLTSCSDSPPPESAPPPAPTASPLQPSTPARQGTTPAQASPEQPAQITKQGFPIPPKEPLAVPTLDSALNDLLSRIEAGEITEADAAKQAPLNRDGTVAVTVHITAEPDDILKYLSDHNITPRHAGENYIEAFLPMTMLRDIAKRDGVVRVEMIVPPHTSQAPPVQNVPGDAPAVHGSIAWNDAGFTGAGIKIGVIDLGFEGAEKLLGTELPQIVEARCYRADTDKPGPLDECDRTHHGTIVAESIIDIAPEASLYLAAVRSRGDLADVVDWMIDDNVSVINMSLSWAYDGPGDGASPTANSALNTLSRAVSSGIVWIASAGNNGQGSWLGTPTDTDGDGLLEFDGAEQLTLNSSGPHITQLRWAGDWNAEATDLDLHIFDSGGDPVAEGLNPQAGQTGQHPYEIAFPDGQDTILQVVNHADTLPDWIQIVVWSTTINETTQTGSITNPAESASPGMLTVGAANWQRIHDIEGYSSRGPVPDGRTKPDLVAAACGETASPRPGYIFCGTSQAAPHVAGMAALVRQRFPDLTPSEMVEYLTQHSEERGAPGPDNIWGAGFVMLPPPDIPTPTATPTPTPSPTPLPSATPSPTPTATPTPEPNYDREALEELYRATDGDNWWINTKWLTDAPLSEWHGVELDSNGRVTKLFLERNLLSGSIPEGIDRLSKVQGLYLGDNDLTGSLPPSLGNLKELRTLDISRNNLDGSIPPELGMLAKLRRLTLNQNQLSGEIPATLGNLTKLIDLTLFQNQITGAIPSEIQNLTKLITLNLEWNQLTGQIPPGIGNFKDLYELHLSVNQLTGPIPAELGQLQKAQHIYLASNELTGPIPPQLGNATWLRHLYLSRNNLSGNLPPELANLPRLEEASLSYNQITGTIPPEFAQLTQLKELDLRFNPLSGPMPQELTQLTHLTLEIKGTDTCAPDNEDFYLWSRTHWQRETGTHVPLCGSGQ